MDKSQIKIPSVGRFLLEPLGLLEILNNRASQSILKGLSNGNGELVVLIPGFGTGDVLTSLLRNYLKSKNFNVYGWDCGINWKYSEEIEEKFIHKLNELTEKHQQKVTLVGYSLGGVTARIIANRIPNKIKQVIIVGTPIQKINGQNNLEFIYPLLMMGEKIEDFNPVWVKEIATVLPMPSTSIYSKKDGIVPWQNCMDWETGPTTENVEIFSSHLAMFTTPCTWYIIVDRLLQAEDNWQLFDESKLEQIKEMTIFDF